jgi:hypothetical protein
MPRSRSVATRENDTRALEYRRRGLDYRQIAAQMGWRAASSAYAAVQRALADTAYEVSDEVRAIETARLDDLTRVLHRVLVSRHYVVSVGSGRIVRHPDSGEPLVDDGPTLHAVAGLLRIAERRAKLLGLDAPTRHEVITTDALDAEIRRLEAEMGERGGHPGGSASGETAPPA